MPSQLPPPPVPAKLREMLKDYPEYIQELQRSLSSVVEKPSKVTPLFEQAIWALEGALGEFIDEARKEVVAAEASGDPVAIEKAKAKDFAVGSARLRMGGFPELWDYCQVNKEAL